MKKIMINLLKVKSIVTLLLVASVCIGFLKQYISSEVFVSLVTLSLTSLFKKNEVAEKEESKEVE